MKRPKYLLLSIVVVLALAAFAVGCGGNGDEGTTASPTAGAAAVTCPATSP